MAIQCPMRAPRVVGYTIGLPDSFSRAKMLDGPARFRASSQTSDEIVSVVWEMTRAEFQSFRLWYQDNLKLGALWFEIELDLGGTDFTANEPELELRSAHFSSPPSVTKSPQQPGYSVRASLDIRWESVGTTWINVDGNSASNEINGGTGSSVPADDIDGIGELSL